MSLYVRGDFTVCPNPLSLDPYSICPYSCSFCFLHGMYETYLKRKYEKGFKPVSTTDLHKKLKKAFRSEKETSDPVVKALRFGLPVIIGRKCEPFCGSEEELGATLKMLYHLKHFEVPTVVETKGVLKNNQPYFKVLSDMNAGVNITITPGNDGLAKKLKEPTLYSERWNFAHELKEVGLWVGITGEPIISGVNDSKQDLEMWADNCKALNPTHVNFGDFKVNDLKTVGGNLGKAGFELFEILEAKKKTWVSVGKTIFKMLHDRDLMVTTPDWVNFGLKNDTESCCGFQGLQFKLHHFTFQHALLEIKRKGKVSWEDMERLCIFGEKYLAKFNEIWNGKGGYFNLADVKGVSKVGRDGDGNAIYGRVKSLKEAFI